jgi:glucose/arabinose dehydrogenase
MTSRLSLLHLITAPVLAFAFIAHKAGAQDVVLTELRPPSKPMSKAKEDGASVPRMSLADGIVRGGSFDRKAQRMPKGDIAVGLQEVASGFAVPLVLTFAPGQKDRLYIADQIGIISIVDHSRLLSETFLDLRPWLKELTPAYDERGLLGLAFHPKFDRKDHPGFRKFYTFTSEPTGPCEVPLANAADKVDHLNVVTEWRASDEDSNRVNVGSRRVVFSYATPNFHHNGGSLAFGHDGLLYISVGDGGTGAVFALGKPPVGIAQDNESPRGKILRIDPLGLQGIKTGTGQYSAPSDNPYVGRPGLDAIYALGFRNPWRMSFDRATGDLVVGDVGQSLREEVNIVKRGGNYGWPIKEGDSYFNGNLATLMRDVPWADQAPLIDPALTYTREYIQSGVLSVIGGYVYRGTAIPQLQGRYVFGNWTTSGGLHGQLFHADLRSGEMKEFLIGPSDEPLDGYLVAFGEDAEGELFALTTSLAGPKGTTGKVLRLVAFHGEVKPRVTQMLTEETSLGRADSPIARGKRLFTEKLCATCHQTDPAVPAPPGEALHAPRFLGKFWGQPLQVHDGIGGPLIKVDFNEAYFVESVKEPMKKIHEGSTPGMVAAPMTDDEINALMAYMKSISK